MEFIGGRPGNHIGCLHFGAIACPKFILADIFLAEI